MNIRVKICFLLVLWGFFALTASAQTILLEENFSNYAGNSSTVPTDWVLSTNAAYTSTTNSGDSGPNSYKFDATGSTATSPFFSSIADTLVFWCRGVSTDPSSALKIEARKESDSSWVLISDFIPLPTSGTLNKFGLPPASIQVRFSYTKSAGNLAFDDFKITTSQTGDFMPPVITLIGNTTINLLKDDVFTDPGATAMDNVDGDISANVVVTGTVNTAIVGTYILNYNVSDAAGNSAIEKKRTINVTEPDLTKPTIISATAVSSTLLDIIFSEEITSATGEIAANYVVDNGIGSPTTAALDGTNKAVVHLTFSIAFVLDQLNTITINNIEDPAANVILGNSTTTFTYTVAGLNQIIINEIMSDFNPPVGLPAEEFIELYNTTNQTISIAGWKFSDASTTITLGTASLGPKSYLILCSTTDTALFSPFGKTLGVGSLPSLNDSGDDLKLMDNNDNLINAVKYATSWYQDSEKDGGGWSLELINPLHPCSGKTNWIASNDPLGGTPGKQNSVYSESVDIGAPIFESIYFLSSTSVQVNFSEGLDPASVNTSAISVSNLSISSVKLDSVDQSSIMVQFSGPMSNATSYELTPISIADCWGNKAASTPKTFTYYDLYSATKGEVVINELMPDPDPVPVYVPPVEYIELFNTTNRAVNLTGFSISDHSTTFVIESGYIAPKGFAIICPSAKAFLFVPGLNVIPTSMSSSFLNNTGEKIILRNDSGKVISTITYSDTWYKDDLKKGGGFSLEQIDPYNPCSRSGNWKATTADAGGTPGEQNSVFANNPDTKPPLLSKIHTVAADTLKLVFSEAIDSLSILSATFVINDTLKVKQKIISNPELIDFYVVLDNNMTIRNLYGLEVKGIRDCSGNLIEEAVTSNKGYFALPEEPDSNDIIINEILFNPKTGCQDFVELYNRSDKALDLKDWMLANFDKDTISNAKPIISDHYTFFPKSYVVLSTSTTTLISFFPTVIDSALLSIASMPTYSNDKGNVLLLNPKLAVADRFDYTEKMHFPLLKSKDGVTLERINMELPTNDKSNWHSAATTAGYGTPGFINSQGADATMTGLAFGVSPKVFTPDSDGKNDFTSISFNFESPGFVGTLIIFDAMGRKVKTLANNELLGKSGVYSWDGTNDNNYKSRIGYYIAYFEVFDVTGTRKEYKETIVVGAKYK